jgi:hypothetical protein
MAVITGMREVKGLPSTPGTYYYVIYLRPDELARLGRPSAEPEPRGLIVVKDWLSQAWNWHLRSWEPGAILDLRRYIDDNKVGEVSQAEALRLAQELGIDPSALS